MLPKLIKNYAIILLLSSCHSAIAQQAVVNLHLARPSVVDSPTNQYIHALLTQSFAKVGRTVNGELSYRSMIKALETKLGGYFPRSVSAIEAEVAKQQHLNLMVEPTIMLHYTNQYFFYSHKANKQLITLQQQGLIKMQQSGEFESLYQHYFGEKEQRLSLSTRKVFQLQ